MQVNSTVGLLRELLNGRAGMNVERVRLRDVRAPLVAELGGTGEAQRGGRGGLDDGAAALGQHVWQHVLAGQEAAGDVQVDGAVPFGFRKLDRAAHLREADVVVQHVDPAVLGDHLRDQGGDVV